MKRKRVVGGSARRLAVILAAALAAMLASDCGKKDEGQKGKDQNSEKGKDEKKQDEKKKIGAAIAQQALEFRPAVQMLRKRSQFAHHLRVATVLDRGKVVPLPFREK